MDLSDFDDLQLLTQVSSLLTVLDLDTMLERLIDLSARLVRAERATLILANTTEGGALQAGDFSAWRVASFAVPTAIREDDGTGQQLLENGLAGWVLRNGVGVVVSDTNQDSRWLRLPDDPHPPRSALAVPLIYEGQPVGALSVAHSQTNQFSDYQLRLLTIIANQAAVAIHNARTHTQLAAQRRQMAAVLEAVPNVLIVTDGQGRVIMASDALVPLLDGMTRAQLIGRSVQDFAALDAAFAPIARITQQPPVSLSDWSLEIRSEKRQQDYLVSISVWEIDGPRSDAPDQSGYVIVMRDVTALRDLGRFKDEVLRMASHDLRTPIVLIIGYADLLQMDIADAPNAAALGEYVQGVLDAAERMDTMLDGIKRVGQVSRSTLELLEDLDLTTLVQKAWQSQQAVAERKQQRLEAAFGVRQRLNILGDPVLLQQAFENVIGNAVKYTPAGGRITVRTQRSADSFIFSVTDSGIGISAEDLPHIFDADFRASSVEDTQGTGFGLSLVRSVIQRHNGQITVESVLGEGSTFTITLPLPPTR